MKTVTAKFYHPVQRPFTRQIESGDLPPAAIRIGDDIYVLDAAATDLSYALVEVANIDDISSAPQLWVSDWVSK